MKLIHDTTLVVLEQFFGIGNVDELIITKNTHKSNVHFHFPKLVVTKETAQKIVSKLQQRLFDEVAADWNKIVDGSLFRGDNTGLRLLGTVKFANGQATDNGYKILDYEKVQTLHLNEEIKNDCLKTLKKSHIARCSIRNLSDRETSVRQDIGVMEMNIFKKDSPEIQTIVEFVQALQGHGGCRFSRQINPTTFVFLNDPRTPRPCFISNIHHRNNNFYVKKNASNEYYYVCHSESCKEKKYLFGNPLPKRFDPTEMQGIVLDYTEYETPYQCQAAIVNYLNNYFAYIREGDFFVERQGKTIQIFKNLNNILSYELPTKWGNISPRLLWNKNLGREVFDRLVFYPYLIDPEIRQPSKSARSEEDFLEPSLGGHRPAGNLENEKDKEMNMFTGFEHKYDEDFEVDENLIEPWLTHLKDVWARGDERLYNYILNWHANIILEPATKPGIAMVIKGVQGSGKSIFCSFFGNCVIGKRYFVSTNESEQVVGKFNAITENKMYIVCDEISNFGGLHTSNNKLKGMITETEQSVEKKHHDPIKTFNAVRYCFLTNNPWPVRVEGNDRRYLCIETSKQKKGNSAYFTRLTNHTTKNVGCHFFHYLAFRKEELKKWDVMNIPMTKFRYALMSLSLPSAIRFILDEAHKVWGVYQPSYAFNLTTYYKENYTDWCHNNLDSNGAKTYGILSKREFVYYLEEVWEIEIQNGEILFPTFEDVNGLDTTPYETVKKAEHYFRYHPVMLPPDDGEDEEEIDDFAAERMKRKKRSRGDYDD